MGSETEDYARGRADGIAEGEARGVAAERAAAMTSLHTRAKEDGICQEFGIESRPESAPQRRPHRLKWNGNEWVDYSCGCRYHPDDDNGTHGGGPHVHPCPTHATALTDALDRARAEVLAWCSDLLDTEARGYGLGQLQIGDALRSLASDVREAGTLSGDALKRMLAAAELGERSRIAAAESVSCRYAHEPPGTGDDRPKVVLIVRGANNRRESIILSPETLHVDDRDRLAAAKEEGRREGVDNMLVELERDGLSTKAEVARREREAGAAALERATKWSSWEVNGVAVVSVEALSRQAAKLRATDTRGGGE